MIKKLFPAALNTLFKKILSLNFSGKISERMNTQFCQGTKLSHRWDSSLIFNDHLLLQAYYAIFLNKGRLEVHLSTGARTMRKIAVKPEPSLLHDGREHSVHVERTRG